LADYFADIAADRNNFSHFLSHFCLLTHISGQSFSSEATDFLFYQPYIESADF